MTRILCIGESIIDFISLENGKTLDQVQAFTRQPGGSSANVAIGLSKLNIPVSFTGIIGDDCFGSFLENYLISNNIDCALLKKTDKYNTPIVFVALDNDGDNNFFFYRDFGLNNEYKITITDLKKLKHTQILHFSSVILKQTNFRLQLAKMIDAVKFKNRGLIHFDANIRFGLWQNHNELKKIVIQFIKLADIIKFSEEEIYFVTGTNSIEESLNSKLFNNKLAIVTAGVNGAYTYLNKNIIHIPAKKIEAVDSTGAGDAFVAAFLSKLSAAGIKNYQMLEKVEESIIINWLHFANAAGTLNCLQRGATSGMTDEKNINNFLQ